MHGIKRTDFYKTSEEEKIFNDKLKKGYSLLDSFINYVNKTGQGFCLQNRENDPGCGEAAVGMFELSLAIVEFMPDFYPSWNFRKTHIMDNVEVYKSSDTLSSVLLDERTLTEKVLRASPKCYAAWHHRLWIITVLFNIRIESVDAMLMEEFMLCIQFFKYDSRNFHCWGYMNYIRHYIRQLNKASSDGTDNDVDMLYLKELGKLIDSNFSNYSAWYQRTNIFRLELADDLEILKQAIYTDPKDQCLWHYFDWILFDRDSLKDSLVYAHYINESNSFIFGFNESIVLSVKHSCLYVIDSAGTCEQLGGSWTPIGRRCHFNKESKSLSTPQYVWRLTATKRLDLCKVHDLRVEITFEWDDGLCNSFYLRLQSNPNFNLKKNPISAEKRQNTLTKLIYTFKNIKNGRLHIDSESLRIMWKRTREADSWEDVTENYVGSSVDSKILSEQLDMIDTLIEMDADSKYLLIARLKILKSIEKQDCEQLYGEISAVDPCRSGYYEDMLIQHKIWRILEETGRVERNENVVDLSNMGIRRLNYSAISPHLWIEGLDLSHNKICDRSFLDFGVAQLFNLEWLDLSGNSITDLHELLISIGHLDKLKRLDVSRNPICCLEEGSWHVKGTTIEEIDISKTPLAVLFLQRLWVDDRRSEVLRLGEYVVRCTNSLNELCIPSDAKSYVTLGNDVDIIKVVLVRDNPVNT